MLLTDGCSPILHQSQVTSRARIGEETPFHEELESLPKPQEKLIAAVYKFRDQTGQYKLTETGSSWSTAVTQGATTILIRTLEESGWFRPLERENLANLSAERQIITNTLATYEGKTATALSPLLFAGILLEGGIISYESNVRTGGVGIRYFGSGGSGQYREDKITIYLRAVSTKNGEILKTVYSTKTILSQQIEFGVFRYVKYKRLLEAETGITYNEPSEMAVTEAIEKCVYSLIVEGIIDGFWDINGNTDEKDELVYNYIKEKKESEAIDHLGRELYDQKRGVELGVVMGGGLINNDVMKYVMTYQTGLVASLSLGSIVSLNVEGLYGGINTTFFERDDFLVTTPYLRFNLLPKERLSPGLSVGYGVLYMGLSGDDVKRRDYFGHVASALDLSYYLSHRLRGSLSITNRYFVTDDLDNSIKGSYHDMMWEAKFGISYVFGVNRR